MTTPKVSVLVPVYNTSKYLRKCLDSLAAQTLKEIEIIVVDDGSTDGSGEICDEYAKIYDNFTVIHQKNGGSGAARQTALNAAKGEYTIVCDSDDWTEPDMYEKLYLAAKKEDADIMVCGFFNEYPDGKSVPYQYIYQHLDYYNHVVEQMHTTYNNTWCRLIRRSLFTDNQVTYMPGINFGEDWLILYKLLQFKPKIGQLKANLYHYRKILNGTSYTNQIRMKNLQDLDPGREWLFETYSDPRCAKGIMAQKIQSAYGMLRTSDLDKGYYRRRVKEILPLSAFLKYRPTIKSLIILASKVLPVGWVSRGVKWLYRRYY